jgi:hypothetical protein
MQALSLDIRERIVGSWQKGEPKTSIARRFMVSLSSVKHFIERFETYGHVRPIFEAFVRKVLLPTLQPGQIVMMDNLSSHKTPRSVCL